MKIRSRLFSTVLSIFLTNISKARTKGLFLLVLVLFSIPAFAQTKYYVSSSGNDTNNGTSTSTPWKTISKVNSVTFVSGDAIYFRGGDTFLGQIDVKQSGITIGAYDAGLQKPMITGAVQLTGWTVYSGSIYVTKASSLVKNLFANGKQMTLARYPNSGFISITTKTNSTTFTATGVTQATGYWNGANCRIRTNAWTFESPTVSTQTGNTIVLTSAPHFDTFTTGWGFYLDNKLAALDVEREWYCDPATDSVYFWAPGSVDPGTLTVYGSTLDYGVNSSVSYITVNDLEFDYQIKGGVNFSAGNHISILSNAIYGGLTDGIHVSGPYCIIRNNIIQNVNGNGIQVSWGTNCIISNNTIKSIGLVKGYQSSAQAYGILSEGTYATISNNYVDSIGYDGIYASTHDTVQQNIIKNTMLTLGDGGAIYAGSYTTTQNNIISDVTGSNEGTPLWGGIYQSWTNAVGVYLDYTTHNSVVKDNTIMRASSIALMANYGTNNHTFHNNTCYDCASNTGGLALYVGIDTTVNYGGHVITKNIFYPVSSKQPMVQIQDFSAVLHSPGVIDSNYYCNPYDDTASFETLLKMASGWSSNTYSFSGWKAITGLDAHSKYIIPPSYQRDTIFVNSTASPMTVNLPSVLFFDLDSNSVVGSFILAPYSSKILIRDTVQIHVGIQQSSKTPMNCILDQNYPNPFKSSTEIKYQLAVAGKVQLTIYDMLGREIATLVDGEKGAGNYLETFDGSKLSGGVYVIRFVLTQENGKQIVQTKNILLTK